MSLHAVRTSEQEANERAAQLNQVFFALSDPVRRAILTRLEEGELLVSELAAPFDISLQAVSRHIQVLVRAGLVHQERSGRVSRCRLEAGPIHAAAVWLDRYSAYWRQQSDLLATAILHPDDTKPTKRRKKEKRR